MSGARKPPQLPRELIGRYSLPQRGRAYANGRGTNRARSMPRWSPSQKWVCGTSSATSYPGCPPDEAEPDRAYRTLRQLHGGAYGWAPPDVPGLEQLGATRMLQYVRAWINEGDLVRLDPGYGPIKDVVDTPGNYREVAERNDDTT
jgi:hypothetical protein